MQQLRGHFLALRLQSKEEALQLRALLADFLEASFFLRPGSTSTFSNNWLFGGWAKLLQIGGGGHTSWKWLRMARWSAGMSPVGIQPLVSSGACEVSRKVGLMQGVAQLGMVHG